MRILSGIQPTGAKHLGNYSGGFRQYVATQELGDAYFCIVDLHSNRLVLCQLSPW
jgi:tryptophanyl-tRNA synthetase